MTRSDLLGLSGGVFTALVGMYFGPRPAFDAGLPACGLGTAFPVVAPRAAQPQWLDLDVSDCLMGPVDMTLLVAYLAAVFLIAGAFASRIGEQASPRRGAVAAVLSMALVLTDELHRAGEVLVLPTAMIGVAAVLGAAAFAYAGGRFATARTWVRIEADKRSS